MVTITLALFALAGCSGEPPRPRSVRGIVTYRGAGLPGGVIVFVPDEERGGTGPLCKAAIDADGLFKLTEELHPGFFRVAIAPMPSSQPSLPSAAKPYPDVPGRYRNPQLSGLAAEVKPEVENVFEFQLRD